VKSPDVKMTRSHTSFDIPSIHGGRVANALACNAGGERFAPRAVGDISEINFSNRLSPAQRDLEWSVWHCRTCDVMQGTE